MVAAAQLPVEELAHLSQEPQPGRTIGATKAALLDGVDRLIANTEEKEPAIRRLLDFLIQRNDRLHEEINDAIVPLGKR